MGKKNRWEDVPKELIKKVTTWPALVSWVIESKPLDLLTVYHQSENKQPVHLFWCTPNQSLALYGVGCVSENAQNVPLITNATKRGTGPVVLVSHSFDNKRQTSKVWGQLSEDFNCLPEVLLTTESNKTFITLNFYASSEEALYEEWGKRLVTLDELLESKPLSNSDNLIISQEELFVPEWTRLVDKTVSELKNQSQMTKVVLARQMNVQAKRIFQVGQVLENLNEQQPNTYLFSVRKEEDYFIGATPERLLYADETYYATACVAGSIPRGKTEEEDEALGQELLSDHKNIVEHHYVVKWIEEEMNQITGKLLPVDTITLLKNRDIQHLFLPFKGIRKADKDFKEAINLLHPTPALGGSPKEMAVAWIREKEFLPRGLYGGPVGWYNLHDDTGEVVVGIRSAYISGKTSLLYAGCGIVADSDSEKEVAETKVKFQPMLRALGGK